MEAVEQEKCTALHGVPTHFIGVLSELEKRHEMGKYPDLSRLRCVSGCFPEKDMIANECHKQDRYCSRFPDPNTTDEEACGEDELDGAHDCVWHEYVRQRYVLRIR